MVGISFYRISKPCFHIHEQLHLLYDLTFCFADFKDVESLIEALRNENIDGALILHLMETESNACSLEDIFS